jgi:hypothetical protein
VSQQFALKGKLILRRPVGTELTLTTKKSKQKKNSERSEKMENLCFQVFRDGESLKKMPVFHTKTIESILDPVAQQVKTSQ